MFQHGNSGRGKASKALRQELGSKAGEQALEGTESSLFSHTLYFVWEIHQLPVTEHINKFRMRYMKCCYPRTEFPPLAKEE